MGLNNFLGLTLIFTSSCGHLERKNLISPPSSETSACTRESLLTSSRKQSVLWMQLGGQPRSVLGGFGPALRSHHLFILWTFRFTYWLAHIWVSSSVERVLSRTGIQHEMVSAELPTLNLEALFILASNWGHYVYLISNNTYGHVRHIKDYMFLWYSMSQPEAKNWTNVHTNQVW